MSFLIATLGKPTAHGGAATSTIGTRCGPIGGCPIACGGDAATRPEHDPDVNADDGLPMMRAERLSQPVH